MYHSHLLINVGNNPDRTDWNIGRRWLRNLYRVHQRLCMAFPSTTPEVHEREAAYCRPFKVSDFPDQRDLPDDQSRDVHRDRTQHNGFLFRIDIPINPQQGGTRPVIVVQSRSSRQPDWDYAFGLTNEGCNGPPLGNAGFLLAARPQVRPVSIDIDGDALVLSSQKQIYRLAPGDLVRFRLRANPTRKVPDKSHNGKRKRINPTFKDHVNWLAGKLASATDTPICLENYAPMWAHGWKTKYEPQPGQRMQWWSVLFEGTFRLNETVVLKKLIESGVGSGKAFGFGLLSVAPFSASHRAEVT